MITLPLSSCFSFISWDLNQEKLKKIKWAPPDIDSLACLYRKQESIQRYQSEECRSCLPGLQLCTILTWSDDTTGRQAMEKPLENLYNRTENLWKATKLESTTKFPRTKSLKKPLRLPPQIYWFSIETLKRVCRFTGGLCPKEFCPGGSLSQYQKDIKS